AAAAATRHDRPCDVASVGNADGEAGPAPCPQVAHVVEGTELTGDALRVERLERNAERRITPRPYAGRFRRPPRPGASPKDVHHQPSVALQKRDETRDRSYAVERPWIRPPLPRREQQPSHPGHGDDVVDRARIRKVEQDGIHERPQGGLIAGMTQRERA